MAIPSGRTAFKKKDGVLTLTPDQQSVIWTPAPGNGPPTVSLVIANISNLQQTPDSAAKVMLKIFEKPPDATEQVPYLFHFTSPEARSEANAIKDLLSRLLADIRSGDPSVPKPSGNSTPNPANGANGASGGGGGAGGGSSMTFASSANAKPNSARWFDDAQLKGDIELQQSLMKKDRTLHQTYMDARATKPESISDAAFNAQFWSTRTNLLRAHAIEVNQQKGAYNVLPAIKPRLENDVLKLDITVEMVQLIMAQHPLVKRLYDENVPKVPESEFWSRFFLSKLFRTLKGDRITDERKEGIKRDALFDAHDASENTTMFQRKSMAQSVPHIIDVHGNEENQGGFRSGNQKDVEMRPRKNVPIVNTLNSLSERMLANVAPSDRDTGGAEAGEEDSTWAEIALRDLRGDAKENKIILNIKEQKRFFAKKDEAKSANALAFAKQNPSDVLFDIQTDLETIETDGAGGLNLRAGIGIVDDSDSDDDKGAGGAGRRPPHVGSRAARKAAGDDIMKGIRQRRAQKYGDTTADESRPMGLPVEVAERCQLTHATTVEFLHQFWNAFLSGDPDRANELQYLVESLRRSAERIHAVADEAEKTRDEIIRAKKKEIMDHYKATGKKIRGWRPEHEKGGRKAVLAIMQPTLEALKRAQGDYSRALAAEGVQLSTEA
ncbi:TFIIH p62 subunit domain-containing protein [Colletotrichum godetiae]|uniref:TFIIH p62 subunit domain-containing protein n=1 Tax=Colletotrichum godetiae TaxID=1209918 RepID=A0AAJ0EV93_9PEZI|nr:TFIIH p62 subunit domain-containing protein [Colletotrichum godetiae]KAK1688509.1 TFIIH p62 subunit domain-containing protein [Colletotrichum godetiae]